MEKQKSILIVDDTPEFLEVAKRVYGTDERIAPRYASTHEEALKHLTQERPDGVITDLFFPSEINWANSFLAEIRRGVIEEMIEKGELSESTRSLSDDALARNDKFLQVGIDVHRGIETTMEDYKSLSENPSGLGIGLYCLQEKIPFIMISQGSRHGGNLGLVRYALQYCGTFKKMLDSNDPLPAMLLYGGVSPPHNPKIDKGQEVTWRDALCDKYGGGLLKKIDVSKS